MSYVYKTVSALVGIVFATLCVASVVASFSIMALIILALAKYLGC